MTSPFWVDRFFKTSSLFDSLVDTSELKESGLLWRYLGEIHPIIFISRIPISVIRDIKESNQVLCGVLPRESEWDLAHLGRYCLAALMVL